MGLRLAYFANVNESPYSLVLTFEEKCKNRNIMWGGVVFPLFVGDGGSGCGVMMWFALR